MLICLARAWIISGEFKKRWKLDSTRSAELSSDAKALMERIAASGSLPPASAGFFWPGICNPDAMSHVASVQSCARHNWVISRRASSWLMGLYPEAGEGRGNVLLKLMRE